MSTLQPVSAQAHAPAHPVMVDALSCERHSERAAAEVAERLGAALAGRAGLSAQTDVLLVFVSAHHARSLGEIERVLTARLAPRHVLMVAGEGVIAGALEVEAAPGIGALACVLPGVSVTTFSSDDLPMSLGIDPPARAEGEGHAAAHDDDLSRIAQRVGIVPGHRATIVLADPFSTPIEGVLGTFSRARALCSPGGAGSAQGAEAEHRRGVIAGGFASAATRPGGNALMVDGRLQSSGLIGLSLGGAIRADAVVSQGCKPFGPPMIVTSARGPMVRTLGGRPALDVLGECIQTLTEAERQNLAGGLLLGRVVNEYKATFGRDDYLMRNVVGVIKQEKALAMAEPMRVGQTVRFHVRDATTAHDDLALLMDAQAMHERPVGGLLFTCNGRGTRLFPRPHHDAELVQRAFAGAVPGETRAKAGTAIGMAPLIPLAGFFAAGEVGPVGDGVFLHGQAASLVLFRAP
jgi:small ligand-binding sensory domain FIST